MFFNFGQKRIESDFEIIWEGFSLRDHSGMNIQCKEKSSVIAPRVYIWSVFGITY